MANVGGIELSRLTTGGTAACAAAFSLVAPPRTTYIREFKPDGWEAELRAGLKHVVVRGQHSLADSALIDAAIDVAHRALDLTSTEHRDHLVTDAAADNHILLFQRGSRVVLQFCGMCDFPVSVQISAPSVINAQGVVVPQPPAPAISWSPALRYYRLAHSANDLYEAYRNIYLALEALLSAFVRRLPKEREGVWLRRALTYVSSRANLVRFAPSGTNPVDHFMASQYSAIRGQLFHAKAGASITPHQRIQYGAVVAAFESLVQIWEEIARAWLPLSRGSGVMTNAGFAAWMGSWLPVEMVLTADTSPPSKTDTMASPQRLPVHPLSQAQYLGEQRPGRVLTTATVNVASLPANQTVGRVAGIDRTTQNVAFVGHIEGGLDLADVDDFEVAQSFRLYNLGQPRPF